MNVPMTLACAIAALVLALSACSPTTPVEVKDAYAELLKVQAGTQAGANYNHYNRLVSEAKAKVNVASKTLPEGELKTDLEAVMDNYVDAVTVWNARIDGRSLSVYSEPGYSLLPEYSIEVDGNGTAGDNEKILRVIWAQADKRLKRLAENHRKLFK